MKNINSTIVTLQDVTVKAASATSATCVACNFYSSIGFSTNRPVKSESPNTFLSVQARSGNVFCSSPFFQKLPLGKVTDTNGVVTLIDNAGASGKKYLWSFAAINILGGSVNQNPATTQYWRW